MIYGAMLAWYGAPEITKDGLSVHSLSLSSMFAIHLFFPGIQGKSSGNLSIRCEQNYGFTFFNPFFSIQGRLGSPCGSRVQVIPGHRRCCATFCVALELTEFPTRSIDSDRSYRSGLNSLGLEVGCSKGRDWITLGGTLNSPLKQSSRCLMLEYAHRFSFQNPRLMFYKCCVSKKSISKHEFSYCNA